MGMATGTVQRLSCTVMVYQLSDNQLGRIHHRAERKMNVQIPDLSIGHAIAW